MPSRAERPRSSCTRKRHPGASSSAAGSTSSARCTSWRAAAADDADARRPRSAQQPDATPGGSGSRPGRAARGSRLDSMISEDVRRFAEDPSAYGAIQPESGFERILTTRYCLLFGPVPTFTSVSRLRLLPEGVAQGLAAVRAAVTERGHREAIWWVGSSATPSDLIDLLEARGLVPDEREGSEPHATTMVLAEPPPERETGVVARRVADLEEYRLANRITDASFGSNSADTWDPVAEERFAAERAGHAPRTYLAWLDDEPVGVARALFAADCPAVLMIGGGVVPQARGRGVYRALVEARWDDAVAAGTPALCTQAGRMSRPVLEPLGFHAVAEQEVLLDPTTC